MTDLSIWMLGEQAFNNPVGHYPRSVLGAYREKVSAILFDARDYF